MNYAPKFCIALVILILFFTSSVNAAGSKLLGTSGVTSIEGSAGGGLIPWAPLGGDATRDELGFSIVASEVDVDDYNMSVHGALINFRDRIEFSFAHQDFYVDALSQSVRQNIIGLKVRLFGDLVYDTLPVISIGTQQKRLIDAGVINLVGAKDSSGTDFYLSAAKAWIDGLFHHTSFVNANIRYSNANELGLLGYGGDNARSKFLFETALGVFVGNNVALGVEFRFNRSQMSKFLN
ncbi:DUF3034 family protein [Oleiphilus sp. HI0086]|uniref:DUF3034 family protein n=1 Tax=Oleiphilus sp. HI0086 TaxID=1822260 RepID=UPI0007C28311|nr:DUF3034 family protein [Oleiphilus sp. HI0086]KZZ39128.1 hypothetical protein A3756_09115 [Oleiphilus sp. HI0086]